MTQAEAKNLVVAISSRALFDLDEAHCIYERDGLEAYSAYQIEKEDEALTPGQAFPMVKKLLALNAQLADQLRIEVILLSRNSADTGLRVFNSIEHYGLDITRAAFVVGSRRGAISTHLDASYSSLPRGGMSALRLTTVWRRPHWYPKPPQRSMTDSSVSPSMVTPFCFQTRRNRFLSEKV